MTVHFPESATADQPAAKIAYQGVRSATRRFADYSAIDARVLTAKDAR